MKTHTFSNFRICFLPCLFKNQWNVDKDKTYMKKPRTFFGRKGERCSYQKPIQNPVKHLRWKTFFAKNFNGWKSLTVFGKSSIFDIWRDSKYASGHTQTVLLVQLFLDVIYHYYRPNRHFCNSCICVCVFTSIHREGFIWLKQLEYQRTDQQCCVKDNSFLHQVTSWLI